MAQYRLTNLEVTALLADTPYVEALTQIRMEHARRQLRETHRPITEIARECGYPDTKYFFKQFKRYAGVSPGEWRTMKKDREEEHD